MKESKKKGASARRWQTRFLFVDTSPRPRTQGQRARSRPASYTHTHTPPTLMDAPPRPPPGMGGAAGPPAFRLARLVLAGGALTYGALNSLFNVEGEG